MGENAPHKSVAAGKPPLLLTISGGRSVEQEAEAKLLAIDSELLLESFRQTMTGYTDIEYDEFNLIFVE